LAWRGEKPATGLPAAARAARHRLIADAAREAGVHIVLFGHTADDVAEGDWMRARGSTLGRLQEWSPSPAWPEGRDIFLLRPMLDVGREALRDHLKGRGITWIEDPANADARFARSQARAALAGRASAFPTGRESWAVLPDINFRSGTFRCATTELLRASDHVLSAMLACASGGVRRPSKDALTRLRGSLQTGQPPKMTLAGAAVVVRGREAFVFREPGRTPPSALTAPHDGSEAVWDGRFTVSATEPGWTLRAAAGVLGRMTAVDHAALAPVADARPTTPVLVRDGDPRPVLASARVRVTALGLNRLQAACGVIAHETEIADTSRGADGPRSLCCDRHGSPEGALNLRTA
jgi:tRNA(Ile)-lysidine synthase